MFEKVLALSEKHGFLSKVVTSQFIKGVLKVGSTGALLRENLKREWFDSVVFSKDYTVFLSPNNFTKTYCHAKDMCLNIPPFGVAEIMDSKELLDPSKVGKNLNFSKSFEDITVLKCTVFTQPSNSTQLFHQWQNQRRIWWRKISPNPGRYAFAEIKNDSKTSQVEIEAKYPFGSQKLETVRLHTGNPHNLADDLLLVKDGRKLVPAHCITSETNLQTLLLNYLCDSFEETTYRNEPRILFRFHRKLAPYKISFAITATLKTIIDELYELATYLSRQLKTNHIASILSPVSFKNTLESQWRLYDQLGVPFTILLNENTLKDGVVHLRSRDTTLKEQVHISDLVNYIELLFKNY